MRENVHGKGRRYLTEGRLTVRSVAPFRIEASCRGGGESYGLGHDGHRWWCSCPAVGLCAHLVALQLVTDRGEQPAERAAT
jgi:hypothetical protein